ncbi:hypothetical protein A45J_1848 [hot springs metagenome]|uniref:Uncharacterized protein n=1 Tax=hot springs metagenome TaxID=433727 RepID=A0A5J4L5D5_9ZZZZ
MNINGRIVCDVFPLYIPHGSDEIKLTSASSIPSVIFISHMVQMKYYSKV